MRIIKNLVLAVHILAILIVTVITLSSDHLVLSKGFTKCEQSGNAVFLVEEGSSYSVLYRGDTTGVITGVYKSNQNESKVYIEDIDVGDEVYLLESSPFGYSISKHYRDTLSAISTSEIFSLEDVEQIADFYVNLSNEVAYITTINGGRMRASVYAYPLRDLISVNSEMPEMSEGEVPPYLPAYIRYESRAGNISTAYYDGMNVITDSPKPTDTSIIPSEYSRGMQLTMGQSLKVNTSVLLIYLAYAVAGIIVIALVFNLVQRRRRFVDLLLINEVFILTVTVAILLLTEQVVVAVIWTIVVSIVNIGVIMYESRDIEILCEDMRRISTGNLDLDKPHGNTKDIQVIWRGMNEVKFLYKEYKYIQETTTAAALRFLPHNIGMMFKRGSLDEIKPGDSVNVPGTFMMFRTQKAITNDLVELAEEYEKNAEGTLLTGECSLSEMKMLFPYSSTLAVRKGLDFYEDIDDDSACAIYFKDNFKVSMVGTASKSILNFESEQMKTMVMLSAWFFRMGLKMVISEDVKNGGELDTPLRNIGFCYVDGKKKQLYEVLNANSEAVRVDRMKCQADFDKALSLMYQNDFYLARTAFSDILKIDSTDELARWYLFVCEKYLNNPELIGDKSCALDPRN